MQTEASQTIAIVSLPMLLILGWGIAAIITAYGAFRRAPRFLRWGVVALGLMTLLTPLAWYLYTASRPDLYSIGVVDVLILGFLAFLGGGVLVSGLNLPSLSSAPAGKR